MEGKITEKGLKYFTIYFKKTLLLSKIRKRLSEVPGKPVISNS